MLHLRALSQVQNEFEERTWKAFLGMAIEGKSASEVGAALGLNAGAVRMAKCRVLNRLRREAGRTARLNRRSSARRWVQPLAEGPTRARPGGGTTHSREPVGVRPRAGRRGRHRGERRPVAGRLQDRPAHRPQQLVCLARLRAASRPGLDWIAHSTRAIISLTRALKALAEAPQLVVRHNFPPAGRLFDVGDHRDSGREHPVAVDLAEAASLNWTEYCESRHVGTGDQRLAIAARSWATYSESSPRSLAIAPPSSRRLSS